MSRRRGRPPKNLDSNGQPIPGGGTTADIAHLSHTLGISREAVEAMMAAQGSGTSGTRTRRSAPPPAAAPVAASSAWADFMSDEMNPGNSKDKKIDEGKEEKKEIKTETKEESKAKPTADSSTNDKANYALPLKADPLLKSCVLAQTGTLDSSIVGRGQMNMKVRDFPKIDLCEPTLLFPKSIFAKIRIGSITASSSSCHTIAIDTNGGVYGWGRNEDGQLGLGTDMPLLSYPRKIPIPGKEKIQTAAVGKHHSILITQTGGVLACGKNNCGQLGINKSTESCTSFRRSVMVVKSADPTPSAATKQPVKKKRGKPKSDVGAPVVGTVSNADGKQVKFVQVNS